MYSSYSYRSPKPQSDAPKDEFGQQAKQLQSLFPQWSYDDIHSLLVEVNGDTDVASNRLIEGHAEQWGSVTRKKDKKAAVTSSHSKDSVSGRERGDSRGGRGGRAARGGPRGGAARGASARGAHHEVNGHRTIPSQSVHPPKDVSEAEPAPSATGESVEVDADAPTAWTSSTPPTWGGDTAVINGTPSHTPGPTPAPAPTHVPPPAPVAAKLVSKPATSKLSWAQIARKQEKPPPAPAPAPAVLAVPTPTSQPAPASDPTPPPIAPAHDLVSPAEPVDLPTISTGWEEPTTVQAPTWDDEPRPQQAEPISPPVTDDESLALQTDPEPVEEPLQEHPSPLVPPGVLQQPIPETIVSVTVKPLTPSTSSRPTPVSHRAPKYKTSDQPVVLPASFGSGIEKIGMQFGSLSLGGEDFDGPIHDTVPAEKTVSAVAPEPSPVPAPIPIPQPQEPVVSIVSPPSQTAHTSASLFQSSISQPPPQQPPPQVHVSAMSPPSQPTLPTSLTQPALSTQTSHPPTTSASSSINSYSQQPQQSLASHQSQQQSQSQAHHPYSQHGLSAHLDHVPSQPQHHTQGQAPGGAASYFRQSEQYFAPASTPPVGQTQESPYGAFGPLGQVLQGQNSHLNNFASSDYGYPDSQRSFYDSYSSAPTTFTNRTMLGHDETKSLPGAQQPHGAPGLPPSTAQASQQHPSTSQSNQGQPNTSQGPPGYAMQPQPYYYVQNFPYPYSGYQPPQAQQYMAPKYYPQSASGTKGQPPFYPPTESFGGGDLGVGVGTGAEYGKPHQHGYGPPGMQGFMGAGPASAPSQRTASGSPENTFKYGSKDVGVGGVGQTSVGQGPQGRAPIQQHGQNNFYQQRFGQNQPPSQQQQPPQGYPPGGQDWGFYPYQRQQQF